MYQFLYLGDTSLARTNVVTVAYQIEHETFSDPTLAVDVVRFGVAYSNKGDVYRKATGKQIAIERCIDTPHRHIINDFPYNVIIRAIANSDAPAWALDILNNS